jgi:hypothetical protein
MSAVRYDRTTDPTTIAKESDGGTPIFLGTVLKEEDLVVPRGDLSEVTETLRALRQRPIKWTTQIRDLGSEERAVVEPIQIVIEEYSDGSIVARFPEIEVFGEGETEPEAILALKAGILDVHDELSEADPASLGALPRMWLRVLDQIIVRK